MISLFKARKDPTLAKRVAGEMIVDGAIDRASWPLMLAKLWMSAGIVVLSILTALILWIATASHEIVALLALPLCGIIYLIIRVWRGLNRGVDTVTQFAKTELANRGGAIKLPSTRMKEADLETEIPHRE